MFPSMTMTTTREGMAMVASRLFGGVSTLGSLTDNLSIGVHAVQLPEIQTAEVLRSAKGWWAGHGNTLTPRTVALYARTLLATPGYGEVVVFLADAQADRCAVIMVEGDDPSLLKVLISRRGSRAHDMAATYLVGDVDVAMPPTVQYLEYIMTRSRTQLDSVDAIDISHWLMGQTGRDDETILNFVICTSQAEQPTQPERPRTHRPFNVYISGNYAIIMPWMDQVNVDQVDADQVNVESADQTSQTSQADQTDQGLATRVAEAADGLSKMAQGLTALDRK